MSPDRKTFIPVLTAALLAAACSDSEPPVVCESNSNGVTSKVTVTKRDNGITVRDEVINVSPASLSSLLKEGVGVFQSTDEKCGISATEFYVNPDRALTVNGIVEQIGSESIRWNASIESGYLERWRSPISLRVQTTTDGKVYFFHPGLRGWKTEIGDPKLPSDALSEQVLQESRIKIFQGKETQLYLRSSVFEIPLFRDARDGKFAGLSIVLVDAGTIAPENLQGMPKEVQGHYQLFRRVAAEKSQRLNERLEGLEEFRREKEEEFTRNQITSERYESVKEFYEKEKAETLADITKINKPPLGIFMDGRRVKKYYPEWVEDQPELSESITIYMAAGGEFKPHPTQSHPKRKQFPENKVDSFLALFTNDYKIDTAFATPGYVIHHEVSHYETGDSIFGSEYQTDTIALERIEKGLYPFIFVDVKGLTYTKNRISDDEKKPSLLDQIYVKGTQRAKIQQVRMMKERERFYKTRFAFSAGRT